LPAPKLRLSLAGEGRAACRWRQPGGSEPLAEVVLDASGAVAILREEIGDAGLASDPRGGCRVARREPAAAQQAHDTGRLLPGRGTAGRVGDQDPDRRVVGEQLGRVSERGRRLRRGGPRGFGQRRRRDGRRRRQVQRLTALRRGRGPSLELGWCRLDLGSRRGLGNHRNGREFERRADTWAVLGAGGQWRRRGGACCIARLLRSGWGGLRRRRRGAWSRRL
jgi:hypothetical protein